jgi:hypothetical protein
MNVNEMPYDRKNLMFFWLAVVALGAEWWIGASGEIFSVFYVAYFVLFTCMIFFFHRVMRYNIIMRQQGGKTLYPWSLPLIFPWGVFLLGFYGLIAEIIRI